MNRWLKTRLEELSCASTYEVPKRYPKVLRMDTNENLCISKPFIAQLAAQALAETDLREYPSEELDDLRDALGKYLKVSPDCIAVGSGSDQLLDLLLGSFTGGKATTVTVNPTFSFYEDRCSLHSVRLKRVPLRKDFSLDVGRLLSVKGAQVCYICSPNNPTGNQFDRRSVLKAMDSFGGLVILDEAYVEFADYSLKAQAPRRDNLVVLGTMSKAFGLAGARIGYMVAPKAIAGIFQKKIQCPYPLSSVSLRTAALALSKGDYFAGVAAQVKKERARLYAAMREVPGIGVFVSHANFILFSVGRQFRKVHTGLLDQGILVREIGDLPARAGCLRVTVGTEAMNDRFLAALAVLYAGNVK